MADAQVTAYVREWQRMRQNESIEGMNERICEALRVATAQSLPSSPEAWWSWWNSENEVSLMGSKPTELAYQEQSQTYEDIQSASGLVAAPGTGRVFCRRHSRVDHRGTGGHREHPDRRLGVEPGSRHGRIGLSTRAADAANVRRNG